MNDIAKKMMVEKLTTAIKSEDLTQGKLASLMGVHYNYIGALKKQETWPAVPKWVWEILQKWVNSGDKLTDFPWMNFKTRLKELYDIRGFSKTKPRQRGEKKEAKKEEVIPEAPQDPKLPLEEKPEPEPKQELLAEFSRVPRVGKTLLNNDKLVWILENHADCLTTKTGKKYFRLPFWYEQVGPTHFVPHQLGSLPDYLENIIKEQREHQTEK